MGCGSEMKNNVPSVQKRTYAKVRRSDKTQRYELVRTSQITNRHKSHWEAQAGWDAKDMAARGKE
jgi:hypothetical protein